LPIFFGCAAVWVKTAPQNVIIDSALLFVFHNDARVAFQAEVFFQQIDGGADFVLVPNTVRFQDLFSALYRASCNFVPLADISIIRRASSAFFGRKAQNLAHGDTFVFRPRR